jgi:hypothetical protein
MKNSVLGWRLNRLGFSLSKNRVGLRDWAGLSEGLGFSPWSVLKIRNVVNIQIFYRLQIHLNSKQIQTSNNSYSQNKIQEHTAV